MKKVLLLVLFSLPCYLMAQNNLSWEEKVSPKYSYKLPETKKSDATLTQRATTEDPYDKLLAHREDLKVKIADLEQHQDSEKDKQWLDKFRVSLELVEKQIKDYQAQASEKKKQKKH